MRPVNRIDPALPARAFKTYSVLAPASTHFRRATCEEVECPYAVSGWATVVDEGTELGQRQADYIRRSSGRKFTAERTPEGLTRFVFAANQECFSEHKVRVDRDEIFLVRGGDFRGDPTGARPRQHVRPEDWVEDFAEHQQALADRIERG